MDGTFQKDVLSAIIDAARKRKTFPGVAMIRVVYDGTPKGSPLRRLFVDFWVHCGCLEWAEPKVHGLLARYRLL